MKKIFVILLAVCAGGVLSAYENVTEANKAGAAYRSQKDYVKSLAAFEAAAKLSKNQAQKAHFTYMSGIVLCEDKRYEKGIARIREALAEATSPGLRVSCQFHIAYYLGIEKKYEEAIAEMRKVREVGNGEVKHRYIDRSDCYIGHYLMALKRYGETIDAVRDARTNEDNTTAFMALKISYNAYKELKNNEGMLTVVESLLELKDPLPYMFFTSRQYAWERARAQRNHEEALRYADEIVTNTALTNSQRAYGVYYKALSYASMHDKKKELTQWKLLRNCGVKYLENIAASHIRRHQKKK